jgi:hypothetical protein
LSRWKAVSLRPPKHRTGIAHSIRVALRSALGVSSTRPELAQIKHVARRIWADCSAREVKAARMLRFIGVHPVERLTARRVPDELIERVLNFEPDAAIEYLQRDRF